MNKDYKFLLEKSPQKKGECPGCKNKGVFRYYENLSREYGRCERKNNCGFENNPYKETLERKKELYKMLENTTTIEPTQVIKTVYPQLKFIEARLQNQKTNFHTALKNKLAIETEHFKKWGVGGNRLNFNEYTTFVYQTKEKAINIKSVLFNQVPKRDKEKKYSVVYLKAKKGEKYKRCLYGEHLLTNKIVSLVESEKTAVIASYFYPQFDWLATGCADGLTESLISVLFNKEVYYLCDADEAGRNNKTIKRLKAYDINFQIVDLFPERNDGYDLADALLDGLRPEIKPGPKAELQQKEATIEQDEQTEIQESLELYGFYEKGNKYIGRKITEKKVFDFDISNFVMRLLYVFKDGSNNIPYLFELKNIHNHTELLELSTADLSTLNKFKAALLSKGNFNFKASANILSNIIEKLHLKTTEAIYIHTLGQLDKEEAYVFSNGAVLNTGEFVPTNEYGVFKIAEKSYYIPSSSVLNKDNDTFDDERKFKFIQGNIDLRTFSTSIFDIYNTTGLIGLCFGLASVHRDIVFNETKCFPFLFLYGEKGLGKSTFINYFQYLFGLPQSGLTDESTPKSIQRKFSQLNNSILYVKEFSKKFESKISDILKSAYDGEGYTRAQMSNNNKTQTNKVKSALMIDGNYFPTADDALFSRLIFMLWKPEKNEANKTRINTLNDALLNGTGKLFTEIYSQRKQLKTSYTNEFRTILKALNNKIKAENIILSERDKVHISILLSMYKVFLLPIFGQQEFENVINTLVAQIQQQATITDSLDIVEDFFETLNTLNSTGKISNTYHYLYEIGAQNETLIIINFSACYNEYAIHKKQISDYNIHSKIIIKERLNLRQFRNYAALKPNEKDFIKKFNGNNARAMVFEVEADNIFKVKF